MRSSNLLIRLAAVLASAFGGQTRIHQPLIVRGAESYSPAFMPSLLPAGGGHIERGSQRQIRKRLRRRRHLRIRTPRGTRLVSGR